MSRTINRTERRVLEALDYWHDKGRRDALAWKPAEDAWLSRHHGWAYMAGHAEGVRERTEMEKRRREVLGCPCDGKKAGK